ncbi:MAG TPA: GAF domain-containing protein, partial [Halobacteriales archaeon]|nr:GAF domain-containing protein [Halobacteriales archaeon]
MIGTRLPDDDEARRSEESALKPYRSLIESAPDAILFADAETGRLVEANEAAEELLGRPREEIVEMHQTDLHPPGDADAYREQFARHVESSGTLRRLPDGRQMYVLDADGERIPVEINAKAVTVDGEHLIHGIFRDLTRRLHHETALATLNETSRQLLAVDTAEEVHRLVVEAATEALDLAYVTVYVFDVAEGRLRPAERSGDVDDLFGELPTLEPGESVAWRAFTEGEELIYDDVTEADDVVDADVPIRSALFVPLGDHGVLLAGDTAPAAFEGSQTEHASVLGATATAALDRVERDRRLRRRDEMLAERNEQLERVEGLNRVLREVDRMLVRADTRESVEQTVCERLLHTNPVSFAWIGEANPVDGRVDVRSAVGTGLGYLSDVDLGTESGTEPAVATVRSGETTMVVNVADGVRTEEWRGSAIAYGFRSVLAIPLTYRDVLYGVLAVYAERPSAF